MLLSILRIAFERNRRDPMTRKARNPTSYSEYSEHYVADPAEYRPDPNPRAYHMIPPSYPKIMGVPWRDGVHSNARYPDGLVDISRITGPQVRRLTPGYLDRIFKGKSTVAMRQRYIQRIIDNPRAPTENVGVAVRYVRDNPHMFIPEAQSPMYSDDVNRVIGARNGDRPEAGFVSRISALFPRTWSR